MHAPHAHVLDTHAKHAFVTTRLGGEHICVSTKTAIDAILRVHARDMHMLPTHKQSMHSALHARKRSACCLQVYMWVVTVCASARVLREPLRGPHVQGLKGAAFRTAVALNEFKALCRELVWAVVVECCTPGTLPLKMRGVVVNEMSAWWCKWVLTNLGIRESPVCTRPRYDFTQEDTT